MRWVSGFLVVAVLITPTAAAGTSENPELTDESGDATVEGYVPAPWGDSTDLRAVWFTDGAEGLISTIRVADLAGLISKPGQVQSDAMFIARFWTDHADSSGRAGRQGEWTLRADYQGISGWGYWAEAPCADGLDYDGCSGADRDIIDPVPGTHDIANDTVSLTLPWAELGNVTAGDGIRNLTGSTQFVYPAYPVYAVDWDTDQEASASYRYASLGTASEPVAAAPLPAPTVTVTVYAAPSGEGKAESNAGGKSPGPGFPLLLAGLVAMLLVRRVR